jgi:hypothetical protein
MNRLTRHMTTTALALCAAAGTAITLAADLPTATTVSTQSPAAPATAAAAAVRTTAPATTTASATPVPTTAATSTSGVDPETAPTTSGSSTFTGRPGSRDAYREQYAILADRNIFVKERSRIVPSGRNGDGRGGRDTPRDVPRQPPAESSYILTGIVLEDGQVHAFVEDMKAGKVLRLSRGDAVARGQIIDISIDAVQYLAGGQMVWVELGRDFTGAVPSSSTPTYSTSTGGGSTTGPSSAPTASGSSGAPAAAPLPIDPNNPNLTLEERMKLRRQQQLNK